MDRSSFYIQLISGKRKGPFSLVLRGVLRILSWLYAAVIAVRNGYYNRLSLPTWLEVPVISVGNLTVGGTGKTPMALWLCQRFLERGRKPAVLSRGYKASEEGIADELLMISKRCPEAVAIANPNRAAAGQLAVEGYAVRAAVLDDGFQHRRVGRDLDIVLVDATEPFGYGYMLPRGLLREPVANLRRAEAVVVTRCDQVEPGKLADLDARIRQINTKAPLIHATHTPVGFVDLEGREIDSPAGGRIGCFAGIAQPEAFVDTLKSMKLDVADVRFWPDHHVYTTADVEIIRSWVRDARLDVLVTTEKDAVKLSALDAAWPVPVASLRVEIEMLDDGDRILADLIDTMLLDHEENDETETG